MYQVLPSPKFFGERILPLTQNSNQDYFGFASELLVRVSNTNIGTGIGMFFSKQSASWIFDNHGGLRRLKFYKAGEFPKTLSSLERSIEPFHEGNAQNLPTEFKKVNPAFDKFIDNSCLTLELALNIGYRLARHIYSCYKDGVLTNPRNGSLIRGQNSLQTLEYNSQVISSIQKASESYLHVLEYVWPKIRVKQDTWKSSKHELYHSLNSMFYF